jgi:hypothetical protein
VLVKYDAHKWDRVAVKKLTKKKGGHEFLEFIEGSTAERIAAH